MSRLRLLSLLPFVLVALAGLGLWMEIELHLPAMRSLTISASLLAAASVGVAIWQRQSLSIIRLDARTIWRLGGALAFGVFLALVILVAWFGYTFASRLVHPNRTFAEHTPEWVGITNYQAVQFPSKDGLILRGWYIAPHNGIVIVFVHGWKSNRGYWLDDAAMVTWHGYGALLFDLRNSGESEGAETTLGLREVDDVSGAVDFALSQPGAEQVALFGHSMGAATVIIVGARDVRVAAVIAQNAFTNLQDNIDSMFRGFTGLPSFPFVPLAVFFGQLQIGASIDQVRPISEIAAISPRPILLIQGSSDTIVPPENVDLLFVAARPPKVLYIVEGGGHYRLFQVETSVYEDQVLDFLDANLTPRR
jgi:fermentation-respiration switch protein FrsA (DUF1100 family)